MSCLIERGISVLLFWNRMRLVHTQFFFFLGRCYIRKLSCHAIGLLAPVHASTGYKLGVIFPFCDCRFDACARNELLLKSVNRQFRFIMASLSRRLLMSFGRLGCSKLNNSFPRTKNVSCCIPQSSGSQQIPAVFTSAAYF